MAHELEMYELVKAARWFTAPNPGLGNVTPVFMIESGCQQKRLQWIQNQLQQNKP